MRVAKGIAWLALLAMTAVLIYGFTVGDFGAEGGQLTRMPWGIVSLVDLYAGFALFSIWIVYREARPLVAALWVALMMVLGFWAGALYMLLALYRCDNDWSRFWLGARHANSRAKDRSIPPGAG
jgi:hypothetical protein